MSAMRFKKKRAQICLEQDQNRHHGERGICNTLWLMHSTLVSVTKELLNHSNGTALIKSPKDIKFLNPLNTFSSYLLNLSVSFDPVNHFFILAMSHLAFVIQSLSLCSSTTGVSLVSFGSLNFQGIMTLTTFSTLHILCLYRSAFAMLCCSNI